jgi:hypothetical protein
MLQPPTHPPRPIVLLDPSPLPPQRVNAFARLGSLTVSLLPCGLFNSLCPPAAAEALRNGLDYDKALEDPNYVEMVTSPQVSPLAWLPRQGLVYGTAPSPHLPSSKAGVASNFSGPMRGGPTMSLARRQI